MNLSSFLIELREATKNTQTNGEAISILREKLPPGIKFSYEFIPGEGEPFESQDKERKYNYDHLNNGMIKRVLLTTFKTNANFDIKLTHECNGVILLFPTWEIIAQPPYTFNTNYRAATIGKLIKKGKYNIYRAYDGTVVNAYYFEGSWRLSTSNGFDVTDLKWMSDITFKDAFLECLELYNLSFDNLDTEYSYSIGFRHHAFHPLIADPQKAWFIHKFSRKTGQIDPSPAAAAEIGLPFQEEVNCSLQVLFDINKKSQFNFERNKKIHYGWVLRGTFEDNGSHANILLESIFMFWIRKLMYNTPKNAPVISYDNRLNYMILRAAISPNKNKFIMLFPQYKKECNDYVDLLNKTIDCITHMLRSNKPKKEDNVKVTTLANKMIDKVRSTVVVNPVDNDCKKIINDIIFNESYLNLYYEVLIKK